MKKIIITVAASAVAIFANAAQIKWQTYGSVANATEEGLTAATLTYLVDASVLNQKSIYEAVSGGKTLEVAIGNNYVKSASMSDGMISAQTFDAFSGGDSKSLYMVLFDSGVGENGAIYFSEQATTTIGAIATTAFSFMNDYSIEAVASDMTGFNASSGGWVAVPEPTSAMLLMFGLCGLALKRKNA